ncbi:hypothetical protein C8J57DRAFT_1719110 [Mycena rebaudengoi]|nr:hypothetical protein C8J57DRAFT_1719110 [Mycena rebaudengoi]
MRETEVSGGGGVECRVVPDEDEEACTCTAARGIPASALIPTAHLHHPRRSNRPLAPAPKRHARRRLPPTQRPPSASAWCCCCCDSACCRCASSPTHSRPRRPPQNSARPIPEPQPPSIPSASAPAPSSTSIAFPSASYTHGVYRNDTAPLKDAPLPLRAAAAVGVVGRAAVVARSRIRVRRAGTAVAVTTRRRRVPRPRIPHRRLRIPHAALVPSVHPHRHHRKAHIGRGVLRHPADGDACCDSLPMGDGCCECECADEWDSTDDCDCDRAWRPIPIPTPNPPTGDAEYPLPPSIGDGFTPDDIALPGLRYPPPPTPGMEIGIGMRWCWCEVIGGVCVWLWRAEGRRRP